MIFSLVTDSDSCKAFWKRKIYVNLCFTAHLKCWKITETVKTTVKRLPVTTFLPRQSTASQSDNLKIDHVNTINNYRKKTTHLTDFINRMLFIGLLMT